MKKVYEVNEEEYKKVSCTLSGDDVEYGAINLVTRAFARLGQDAKRVRLPDGLLRLNPEYKATAKVIGGDEVQFLTAVTDAAADRDRAYLESVLQ